MPLLVWLCFIHFGGDDISCLLSSLMRCHHPLCHVAYLNILEHVIVPRFFRCYR
uniref:Uncharacterized protein n=1 Tax=Zea mays TaxID=4577 RepID=C4J775_MAIZE|nr:unknown [Zea mays]